MPFHHFVFRISFVFAILNPNNQVYFIYIFVSMDFMYRRT